MNDLYKYLILCDFFESVSSEDGTSYEWPTYYDTSEKRIFLIDKLIKFFEKRDSNVDYERCRVLLRLKEQFVRDEI